MDFKEYKDKTKKRDIKSSDELRSHLISYIAVNIGIFLLNIITSAGYPWFLFVVGGWGIGMASHWGSRVIASKNLQDIQDLKDLDDDELRNIINYHKAREGFFLHIISNTAVAVYLFTINIITSTVFMWSFIPMIGMGIGIATHWGQYSGKRRQQNFIDSEKNQPEIITQNVHLTAAMNLRESIVEVIKEIRGKFKNFAEDLLPKIDIYVETIGLLIKKENDLNASLKQISQEELVIEREKILKKRDISTSEQLITEYNNFIQEIDNHIKTIDRLTEEGELLHIKISTSVNSLKHLNLELVGMKSKTTMEDKSIISDFDKKSADLALYYKDLLDSYDELII